MTMSFAGFSCNPILSNAFAETEVAEGFRIYTDDVNKFKISVPKGWSLAASEPDGFKSVTAFYPEGNTSPNGMNCSFLPSPTD
ncbi:psbP domain-containing protein 3, chloroplastic-like [Humulus lupulus]|uniref:psbP domain-containing protein 3, chloroplastic-like n=1 Tax=Humulus lupulus TaxID=3486 RepID=UPI002B40C071|nr:psbP domain-containing protein 3, chloroplastic-like [Humulus lupulus]